LAAIEFEASEQLSHLLGRLDAEGVQALLGDAGGQAAEGETGLARGAFGFEDGAGFVESSEVAGKFVEAQSAHLDGNDKFPKRPMTKMSRPEWQMEWNGMGGRSRQRMT